MSVRRNTAVLRGKRQLDERQNFLLSSPVNIDYNVYGHSNVGTIEIKLVQNVIEGEDDLTSSPHDTTKTGTSAETYTLSATYLPKDADVSNLHTGAYGTKRPGNDTDDIVSENVHKINVFAKDLEILKKDIADTSKMLDTAKFILYRTARKKKDPETGMETDEYEVGAEDLKVGGEMKKAVQVGSELTTSGGMITVKDLPYAPDGIYYLVETEAPEGYDLLKEPIAMYLYLEDAYTHYLAPYGSISKEQTAENPYNWAQTVKRFVYESAKTGVVENTKITIEVLNSSGVELPSTGGPGTRLFAILGSILTLGAGVLLWRRRSMT